MEFKQWLSGVTPDDMPNDDLKFIAETAGIKPALALIICTPGLIVSIPKNALNRLKEKYIISNYQNSKYSLNKLAIECELTPRHIYNIINKHRKKSSS